MSEELAGLRCPHCGHDVLERTTVEDVKVYDDDGEVADYICTGYARKTYRCGRCGTELKDVEAMAREKTLKAQENTSSPMPRERPNTVEELQAELAAFTGSENWYRHWTGFKYTDGVKYMADRVGAYWLLDVVGSYQRETKVRSAPFQIWRLESRNQAGQVTMREDDGEPHLVEQRIEYTDFPQGIFEMYYTDNTLLLKSEY